LLDVLLTPCIAEGYVDVCCIPGGFFDGKTSNEERREYLLSILKQDGQAKGAVGQGLTTFELNKLLARGKAEIELFEAKAQQWEASGRAGSRVEVAASPSGEHYTHPNVMEICCSQLVESWKVICLWHCLPTSLGET
jgi:hypothetical protein